MSNENGNGFLTGLILGATLGAIAALLLAPKSGKDLRRSLREEGERLRDEADAALAEARRRGEDIYRKTRDTVVGREPA